MKTASLALALLLALAACNKSEGERISGASLPSARAPNVNASADAPTLSPQSEAEDIYRTRCAMCHGDTGHGDGPSRLLQPKPRDFGDKAFQKGTTDDAIAKVIVEGGEAVGKSAVMPKSPELASKGDVVRELVKRVRSFGP